MRKLLKSTAAIAICFGTLSTQAYDFESAQKAFEKVEKIYDSNASKREADNKKERREKIFNRVSNIILEDIQGLDTSNAKIYKRNNTIKSYDRDLITEGVNQTRFVILKDMTCRQELRLKERYNGAGERTMGSLMDEVRVKSNCISNDGDKKLEAYEKILIKDIQI